VGGQRSQLRRGFLHHRSVEGLEQAPCLVGEAAKLRLRPGAREIAYSFRAQLSVGVQVKRGAIAPPVPGKNRIGMERDVILQPFAHLGEHLLEHVAHGHHGRPDIHRTGHAVPRAHLAAGARGHVDHVDRQAPMGQPERGRQAADPSPDDDDAAFSRVCAV
jgi:hypothetical protein